MGVLHREHCTKLGADRYLKDISRLGRDLSRVVMIEADPLAAKAFPHNTVLIKEYDANNVQDKELEGLRLYLKELANQEGDLRPSLRSKGQDPETISKMVVSQETRDGFVSSYTSVENCQKHVYHSSGAEFLGSGHSPINTGQVGPHGSDKKPYN
eukprot:Protomagalhaensia_wolfi_Nauph_80__137@NODE_1078_length_1756_cov_8_590565_g820_i0_p2_GENE_NODE_1078_length_1756_cov_8_590565_g820_i0NODE_1078_length_1756_cov_8_590565_g820_i0_p2_ORF_typecomplete_len155_score17_28NIF/PF03031_18/5_8e14_NODE_1078_length_1756_cov_8_590565_g820_i05981062